MVKEWNEFHNKMEQVFGKSFHQADDLYYNIKKEVNYGESIELNDIEALKYLQNLHIMKGTLYVITDFCYYKSRGPFIVKADEIKSFVSTFYETYGEDFYSTDIIIVNFEEKRIWVLFHEGKCWLSEK